MHLQCEISLIFLSSTISSLKWSPEYLFWRSLATFPNIPSIAIMEKENCLCYQRKLRFGPYLPLYVHRVTGSLASVFFLQSISMVIATQDYNPIIVKSIKLTIYCIINHKHCKVHLWASHKSQGEFYYKILGSFHVFAFFRRKRKLLLINIESNSYKFHSCKTKGESSLENLV